ncbi:MAG: transposase [Eubacteriaceae bacterium]|nr:transposase [Eubacteriaceae bacterium]
MKNTYSAEFKAKAVLELLREEENISQISSKHEVHPNLLKKWRKAVIEGLPELLAGKRTRDTQLKEPRVRWAA